MLNDGEGMQKVKWRYASARMLNDGEGTQKAKGKRECRWVQCARVRPNLASQTVLVPKERKIG